MIDGRKITKDIRESHAKTKSWGTGLNIAMKSLCQKAFKVLEISLGEAHSSGVKLFMTYRYGRPKGVINS